MVALTADQSKRADALRARRWTPGHIARHLGVTGDAIRQHLGMRPQRWVDLTAADLEAIRSAFGSGTSREALCQEYRIGHRRADEICADVVREGVERKTRKPRSKEPKMVPVPGWVPTNLHDLYLNVAERDGEEEAASVCRRLKNGGAIRVAHQRLPLVVSPVGY